MGNSNSEHVCHSPQDASSPVHFSDSGASSSGDRCSVRLAGEADVQDSTFPLLNKSFRTKDHPGGRGNSNSPLVAVLTVVPTSTTSVCESPSHHSVPPGPTVTTRVCLRQKIIPSACLEVLMQNYQAAGFSQRSLDLRQPVEDPQQTV